MVVYMKIHDESWIPSYFAAVPALLSEYGAVSLAGSREIRSVEGEMTAPDRVVVLSFPSLVAIEGFLSDERYQFYKTIRERGARSEIFVFDNAVSNGNMV